MTDVVMPQMGESITEGTLTRWLKKPGERVERDEPLFEISTDKVDTEIPSPVSGVLSEVLVQEGATVGINSVVARIGDGAAAPAPSAAQQPAAPAQEPAPARQEQRPVTTSPSTSGVGPSAAAPENRTETQVPQQQAWQAPQTQAPPPPPPQPVAASAGPYPIEPQPPTPQPQADGTEEQGPLSPLVRKMAREY